MTYNIKCSICNKLTTYDEKDGHTYYSEKHQSVVTEFHCKGCNNVMYVEATHTRSER